MRTEKEMMELILSFARNDDRIRVVVMGGSRVNISAPKDEFQDYDIVYFVTDMDSFIKDDGWLDYFGKRIIMQKPEAMTLFSCEFRNSFSYLMLFEDGNRIDLTLVRIDDIDSCLSGDRLQAVLLDKDGIVKALPVPTDTDYYIKKPSPGFFDDCCNEFWWVSTYVAKGLCRREILYASDHLNKCVRPCLLQMMAWKVGLEANYPVSVGKSYKYLERYVSQDVWRRILSTYRNSTYEELWESLFASHDLFREVSRYVAEKLGYAYPDYEENVSRYIKRLYQRYFSGDREEDG